MFIYARRRRRKGVCCICAVFVAAVRSATSFTLPAASRPKIINARQTCVAVDLLGPLPIADGASDTEQQQQQQQRQQQQQQLSQRPQQRHVQANIHSRRIDFGALYDLDEADPEYSVRMYLLERGLNRRQLRPVLAVMRQELPLVNDVDVLACRIHGIASLLDAHSRPSVQLSESNGSSNGSNIDSSSSSSNGVNSNSSSSSSSASNDSSCTGSSSSSEAAVLQVDVYKAIAAEPILLLLNADTDLKPRLRALLNAFPELASRLEAAAPLLAHDVTGTLLPRAASLAQLLPKASNYFVSNCMYTAQCGLPPYEQ
jgi:hypothetical protein